MDSGGVFVAPRERGRALPPALSAQIVRALRRDPSVPDRRLAARFGVDPKTVALRRSRLEEGDEILWTGGVGRGNGRRLVVGKRGRVRLGVDDQDGRRIPGVFRFIPRDPDNMVHVWIRLEYRVPAKPYALQWEFPLEIPPGDLVLLPDAANKRAHLKGVETICVRLANFMTKTCLSEGAWPDPTANEAFDAEEWHRDGW